MSDKTSDSSANYVLLTRLADEFAARYRAGERPTPPGVHRPPSRAGRRHPRAVPGHGRDRAGQGRPPGSRRASGGTRRSRVAAARRFSHPPRGRHRAAWASSTRPSRCRWAVTSPSRSCPRTCCSDAKAKRRFEREAKSAARLHHTNIVPVFGVGEQDGMPYYVMQFIQGLGLDEVLDELKKLQQGGAKAGTFMGSDWRASRKVGPVSDVPGAETVDKTRTNGAVSAVNVARSLLTGEFRSALDQDDEATAPVTAEDACEEDPGPVAPRSPALSDSFTPSSSSVVLPGRSRDGEQVEEQEADLLAERGASIGVQVAEALEYAPQAGDPPPRHQAVEPAPGHAGDGLGDRLRAGQGGRPAEPDAHRRHPRHAALHAAGSLRGEDRRPQRRLFARA